MRNLSRIIKQIKNKIFVIVNVILLSAGIGMDMGVEIIKYALVSVNENYIYYVYASICSVAILSYSIIALITGVIDKKYLGYKVKDILTRGYLNLKAYVTISLIIVGAVTIALFLSDEINVVNTITMSMIVILLIVGRVSLKVCGIMTDDGVCQLAILSYYEEMKNRGDKITSEKVKYDIKSLMSGIDTSLDNNNIEDFIQIMHLLKTLMKCSQSSIGIVYSSLISRASRISATWGYGNYLKNICILPDDQNENIKELFFVPLYQIQYFNDEQFENSKYLDHILEIDSNDYYKEKKIDDITVTNMLTEIFRRVSDNQLISQKAKQKFFFDYFEKLCCQRWNASVKVEMTPGQKAIHIIFKRYIFDNTDKLDRQKLMESLLLALRKNIYTDDTAEYYCFLSELCEAFYLYVYKEKELLTEEARNSIATIFKLQLDNQDREWICLSRFLRDSVRGVLWALGEKALSRETKYSLFEYFPKYMKVKTPVWTEEEDVRFALLIYNLYWDELCLDNFWTICFGEHKVTSDKKSMIVETILGLFDKETCLYSEATIAEYSSAKTLFDSDYIASQEAQKSLFHQFNDIKKELNQQVISEVAESQSVRAIQEKFNEYLEKNLIYGVNQKKQLDTYIKYEINPYVCLANDQMLAVYSLFEASKQAINDCIRRNSESILIGFDIDGINALTDILNRNIYDTGNYNYIENWAMHEYKDTLEYIELKKQYKTIAITRTPNLFNNLLFKKDKLKIRIKLIRFDRTPMDEESCNEYIQNYKLQNGMYNIRGALYTREEAVSFVKKNYVIECMAFKVCYDFTKEDIAVIKIKRN